MNKKGALESFIKTLLWIAFALILGGGVIYLVRRLTG